MDDMENQARRLAVALRRLHDRVSAQEDVGALPSAAAAGLREQIDKAFTDLGLPPGGLKENTIRRTPGYGDRGSHKLPMA